MAAGRWPLALFVTLALLALMLLSIPPAGAQTAVDYDTDDDRLIEIDSPAKLNAIRYDLNGSGTALPGDQTDYDAGFANADASQCPTSCQGYELTADLDLSTAFPAWTPIGGSGGYNATFDGNGYTITGLTVNIAGHAGLFGRLGGSGVIREVGIINASVTTTFAGSSAGVLVGGILQGGQVVASYAQEGRVTMAADSGQGGGLAGSNFGGFIRASYARVTVGTDGNQDNTVIGGLVGSISNGALTASYAAGPASASGANSVIGGLVGYSQGGDAAIADSYCDTAATMQANCVAFQNQGSSVTAPGYATGPLQAPTGYHGLYRNWNIDLDGDGNGDRPWDFGSPRHYPLLRVDKNGDGRASCREFSGQRCYIPPTPPPYNPAHDHPEIYANPRYVMAVSCAVETTGAGDAAVSTSTLTFNLGRYIRPITLALSLWDGDVFRSLQSQNIAMPELRREGRMATVEVVTDPAQTRFRLDSEYGLNLVLGYADCHTDDPEE